MRTCGYPYKDYTLKMYYICIYFCYICNHSRKNEKKYEMW